MFEHAENKEDKEWSLGRTNVLTSSTLFFFTSDMV
jgi:hypothetical protein